MYMSEARRLGGDVKQNFGNFQLKLGIEGPRGGQGACVQDKAEGRTDEVRFHKNWREGRFPEEECVFGVVIFVV